MMTTLKRAAAYLRVSSEEQTDGWSLEGQENHIRAYASFDVLVHFAPPVGQEFGDEFADPQVVRGLADFAHTVPCICANNLNRKPGSRSDRRVV